MSMNEGSLEIGIYIKRFKTDLLKLKLEGEQVTKKCLVFQDEEKGIADAGQQIGDY